MSAPIPPTNWDLEQLAAAAQPITLLDEANGLHDEQATRTAIRALVAAVLDLRLRLDATAPACPTCGSDDSRLLLFTGTGYMRCTDPWHAHPRRY